MQFHAHPWDIRVQPVGDIIGGTSIFYTVSGLNCISSAATNKVAPECIYYLLG